MKIKSWLKYLIYFTLLLFIIVLREHVGELFSASYYKFESRAIFFYIVISLLLGVFIGLLLGFEHLISELTKVGTWKINLPKLVLIGLPSLYFSLAYIWIFSGSQFLREIIAYPSLYFMRYGSGYVSIFQMIFGYVVISSFFKYSVKI